MLKASIELRHRFTLARATPSNNELRGMHWGAYRKLREQLALEVLVAAGKRPLVAVEPQAMLLVRRRSKTLLDWDNAYGGLKPLLDCLVQASSRNPSGLGFIVDDSPKYLPLAPVLLQERKSKAESDSTEVLIFWASPAYVASARAAAERLPLGLLVPAANG